MTREIAEFRLTLRTEPHTIPAIARLRRALKVLLRSFGLRCTEIVEANPTQPTNPKKESK